MVEQLQTVVLVVDDTDASRCATTSILESARLTVWEAETGAGALCRAEDLPDLIVLNANLPDITGLEVCRRLKAAPATSHIPVLLLSDTYIESSDPSTGPSSCADAHLILPPDADELTTTVRLLLHSKAMEKAWRESEEKLSSIVNAAQDAMIMIDPAGSYFIVESGCPARLRVFGRGSRGSASTQTPRSCPVP